MKISGFFLALAVGACGMSHETGETSVELHAAAGAGGCTLLADLSGSAEIPANDSEGIGKAIVRVDAEGTLSWRLVVARIENVTAAHIHYGGPTENGGVALFLAGPFPEAGGRTSGLIGSGSVAVEGVPDGPLGDAFHDLLLSGLTYVNVHTSDGLPGATGPGDLPAGEIRGQLIPTGGACD
jgi:hypothetical protein